MATTDVVQDLRIALRGLLRAPIMTLTIVISVGLGIGATTTAFSAVNTVLLRPLPYENPDRLVRIYTDTPPFKFPFSVADYLALEAQQTRFERVAGYGSRTMAFSDGTSADRLRGRIVSWTYFSVLGIRPAAGRDFAESDGRPGAAPAVMVSHGFWQQRLGSRTDAIGQRIRLDGVDYALVGVLPPRVGPLEQNQNFFVAAQWTTPPRKGPFYITAIGRLRGDSARPAAADELRAINRRMFAQWRASYQDDRATWSMMDLKEHVIGNVTTVAGVALAAVALVWLIACANASNLLIARVTSRRHELAVRAALGAARGRVVRHLLAESALLAAAAAGVGSALALGGMRLLRDAGAAYVPRAHEIALHGAEAWLLAGLMAASAALFGFVPAVHGTGGRLDAALRGSGRSSTGAPGARRLRQALVGAQFAIATPLLVAAGLLLGSLHELGRVDVGFDTRNLLTGSVSLPAAQYATPEQVVEYWDTLRRRVEAMPGVAGIAFTDSPPPNGAADFNNFDLEDSPTPPGGSQPVTPWVGVSPDYFRLVGLPLLHGRLFDERDATAEGNVVMVDRAWEARFFPNGNAVGKRLKSGGCTTCQWTTVIGVVATVKYAGLDQPDAGTVYRWMPRTVTPNPARARTLVLRTSVEPAAVAQALRQIVRDLDPTLPLTNVATIDELVAQSLSRPRSLSWLVGGFAIVALALSVIGVYGVMSYFVQQQTKEIGIRLALGGSRGSVLRLVLGQGMTIVAGGVAIGLGGAFFVTRLMATLLFRVSAHDAFTFSAVASTLLAVAVLACLIPAGRAVGVQPAFVLRNE